MISVLLPVFNGGHYLKKSVESVLNQYGAEFEFLIIDDCSSDDSYTYLLRINDSRVKLFKNQQNQGLFFNINFLIKRAKGNLFKLWSQDDVMLPGCLAAFDSFHGKHPEVGFSYCQPEMIDEFGVIKNRLGVDKTPEIISRKLHGFIALYTGSIAGNISNTCISAQALNKVGLFDERMKISADFDMWVRIAEFFPVGHLNQKWIQMRDHEGQLSRNPNYQINHIEEDMIVYLKLLNYLDKGTVVKGAYYLRNYKLVFYYTLMLKFLFRFRLKEVINIAILINRLYSLIKLTFIWIKIKLFRIKPISFNSEYLGQGDGV